MEIPERVIGHYAAVTFAARVNAPVLVIGSDRFTRADLAGAACFNFVAAARLSKLLSEHLSARNVRHVFNEIPPSALAIPGLGYVSLLVLGAAFEAVGIGGDTPLSNYIKRHADGNGAATMVTFHTLKSRELAAARGEKNARTTRKAARRDRAHGLRAERHARRSATASTDPPVKRAPHA